MGGITHTACGSHIYDMNQKGKVSKFIYLYRVTTSELRLKGATCSNRAKYCIITSLLVASCWK